MNKQTALVDLISSNTATATRSIGRQNAARLALGAIALCLASATVNAEITEDCILEGTVDMRKAEALGQPIYVNFSSAKSGTQAKCSMARRGKTRSRRVTFVSSPDVTEISDAAHGSTVRYRYIERDNQPGRWELMEVSDSRSSS